VATVSFTKINYITITKRLTNMNIIVLLCVVISALIFAAILGVLFWSVYVTLHYKSIWVKILLSFLVTISPIVAATIINIATYYVKSTS
jgi:hypothetical protein